MKWRVIMSSVLVSSLVTLQAQSQTFVIDSLTRSPDTVTSGGVVQTTVRVRNPGPGSGQLRSVTVVPAPVSPPLVAVPTTVVFNPPRLLTAGQALNVNASVNMPVLNNCTTVWSFGFDVTVDGGSSSFTQSFTGVGHNVTVNPFCSDLTAPRPPGWTSEVVLSNTLNASTTPGVLSALLPIYMSCDVTNLGGPTPAGVPCVLRIVRSATNTPVYSVTPTLPPMANNETNHSLRNTVVPVGVLIPCDNYTAQILIDPNNVVPESNNNNNQFASAVIFLNAPQTITTQPTNQVACRGGTATFRVVVNSGGAEVSYRWRRNGMVMPISGPGGNPSAATNTLVIPNVQAANLGQYSCSISNACDALTSQTATLTFNACTADYNCDGVVNSQDYFDFLACFFTNCSGADFNGNSVINSQDYFDFLVAFFTGC